MAIFNSWKNKLKEGLRRSAADINSNIASIFRDRKLDSDTIQELEDVLISADFGVEVTNNIVSNLTKKSYNKSISSKEVRLLLRDEIVKIVEPCTKLFSPDFKNKPHIILFIGVNGSGKTTSIGKIAAKFKEQGKSIMLAAGDTFRAAAIEQLSIWAQRLGVDIVTSKLGGDAASLIYDAYKKAIEQNVDLLLIDTAGRLQNKVELLEELAKIIRVLKKLNIDAPHDIFLVLDGTVGQNAISQVAAFQKTANVTGLLMTKLDGTARGGILVAICKRFALPIYYIGVGEQIADLETFNAIDYANNITMIEEE